MINIMSGTTAVTLSPSNNASKGAKGTTNSTNANNKNSTVSGGSNANVSSAAANTMQAQNTQNSQQNASSNSMQSQVQAANTQSADYSKEAIAALQSRIRKDYINRNYYVDKDTNIPVLQVVNSETGRVIGQYPADMYLNLIMRVRENQKSMVSQQSMETQQTITNQINVTNQQANIEQQLMANQKS